MISSIHSTVFSKISALISDEKKPLIECLKAVCECLKNEIEAYDWVGFYFSNFKSQTLHLKAFSGTPTDHIVIPFGKGICGQVALSNKNFVVPDVTAQDNYIACSLDVRAELVVPLFLEGQNIGQIDIDSKSPDPFSKEDETFLEAICELVASTYGNSLKQL